MIIAFNLHSLCYFNWSFIRTALLVAVFIFYCHCHDKKKYTWKADKKQRKYKKTAHKQSMLNICVLGKNISDF